MTPARKPQSDETSRQLTLRLLDQLFIGGGTEHIGVRLTLRHWVRRLEVHQATRRGTWTSRLIASGGCSCRGQPTVFLTSA